MMYGTGVEYDFYRLKDSDGDKKQIMNNPDIAFDGIYLRAASK
jgi:hypothetical protein